MAKIRKGFVSNSSSSSFIIIGTCRLEKDLTSYSDSETMTFGDQGETEFGWAHIEYRDMWSRINFTYLQAYYSNKPEWLNMLESTLKSHFRCSSIVWNIDGYIDHQSAATEGMNTEMFDNIDTLNRFLFCVDSYIQGDNDNR